MTRYELMTILNPEIQDEELTGELDRIRKLIADRGGTDETTEVVGHRRLAYPIRGKRDGTMVVSRFDMTGESVNALSATLRSNENRLRTLVTRA